MARDDEEGEELPPEPVSHPPPRALEDGGPLAACDREHTLAAALVPLIQGETDVQFPGGWKFRASGQASGPKVDPLEMLVVSGIVLALTLLTVVCLVTGHPVATAASLIAFAGWGTWFLRARRPKRPTELSKT